MILPADTTAKLRRLIKLAKKHERLRKELADVEKEYAANLDEVSLPDTLPTPYLNRPNRVIGMASDLASEKPKCLFPKPKFKSGELKIKILAALKEAGDEGLSVKSIAAKLGTHGIHIHGWFHGTGKKIPGVVRIKPGHWAYEKST